MQLISFYLNDWDEFSIINICPSWNTNLDKSLKTRKVGRGKPKQENGTMMIGSSYVKTVEQSRWS